VGAFWRTWWGTIVSPGRTLHEVGRAGLNVTSFLAYGLFPLLYSASVLLGYVRGATPDTWKPWVDVIPFERYYLWEAAVLIPLSLQLWIGFAAHAHPLPSGAMSSLLGEAVEKEATWTIPGP